MAQTSSALNNPFSGNLGNQTYKNYGGKQVITSRFRTTSAKGANATRDQRMTRLIMPNLSIVASRLKDWLPIFWETSRYYTRPYTRFISHNINLRLPVLPRDMIEQKYCTIDAMQMSFGTLPPIEMLAEDGDIMTNLHIGDTWALSSSKWNKISEGIIKYNDNWKEGDFLVIIHTSWVNSESLQEAGYFLDNVTVNVAKIDTSDTRTVSAVFPTIHSKLYGYGSDWASYRLELKTDVDDGFAVIHVRKSGAKYLSSPSVLTHDESGQEYYDRMRSDQWIEMCAQSWGYKDSPL